MSATNKDKVNRIDIKARIGLDGINKGGIGRVNKNGVSKVNIEANKKINARVIASMDNSADSGNKITD